MSSHDGEPSEQSESTSQESSEGWTESSSSSDSGEWTECSSTLDEELVVNLTLFEDLSPRSCIRTEPSGSYPIHSVTGGGRLDASPHGAAAAAEEEEDGRQSKKQEHDVPGGGSDERDVAGFGSQHDGDVRTATRNPISKSNLLTPDEVEASGILFALPSMWDSTRRRESTDAAAKGDGHVFKKQDHDVVAGMHHADISVDGSNEEAVLRVSPKKRKRPVYDQQSSPSPFSGKGNDDFKPLIPDINLPAPEEEGDSGTGKPELNSWWPGSNTIRMDGGSPKKRKRGNNDECEVAIPDINLPPPAEGG